MEKFKEILTNVTDVFKGENGPAYAGIIGIVLVVLGRYGYKLKVSGTNSDISLEPHTYANYPENVDSNNFPVEIDDSHKPDNATT